MSRKVWDKARLPAGPERQNWESFHENSKLSSHEPPLSNEQVRAFMTGTWESMPYDGYPEVELPLERYPFSMSVTEAITSRVTARAMRPCELSLMELATFLQYSYGVTRSNEDTVYPRPFRVVPSGGAMYPLEIFVHSANVEGLPAGIYHFNPTDSKLRRFVDGDQSRALSESMAQPNLPLDTGALFFLTAVFERSTTKYGDRGYRFTLLEAGHVAQNLNIVASALGIGSVNIGGFFDRKIDAILGLDGLTHSTIYMVGIGEKEEEIVSPEMP